MNECETLDQKMGEEEGLKVNLQKSFLWHCNQKLEF